jgi:hypothetical protein
MHRAHKPRRSRPRRRRLQLVQLQAVLILRIGRRARRGRGRGRGPVSSPHARQALVARHVRALELVVGWRAGAAEHDEPVGTPAALREGAVALVFEELVRVEVLAGGFAAGHEEDVVAHEGGGVESGDEAVDGESKGEAEVVDGGARGEALAVAVDKNLRQRGASQVQPQKGGAADEGEEIAVVAAANAIVEPDAVVVLRLDAVVAQAAVVGARRAPDVARLAVLGGHLHGGGVGEGGLDQDPFGRRRAER